MKTIDWWGAYSDSLKGKIVDEAFSHPAKFSYGLICRIYSHLLEMNWLKEGDLVADPFAGVSIGGIVAAANGLRWIGCELEQKFVDLSEQNFELNREQWETMGKPYPVIVQGDSRGFSSLIREAADSIVTSPPYSESVNQGAGANDAEARLLRKVQAGVDITRADRVGGPNSVLNQPQVYGETPGQIGAMKEGELEEVVAGIVTSPPWQDVAMHDAKENYQKYTLTYWASVAQVYSECWKALKPNGVMAVVVKAFVRDKQIVDLPSQTLELLEAIGFEPLERIRAWMTSRATQKSLMPDIREDYTKKKASFFRRLYESKYPENAIDFEEVLIVKRPEGEKNE